MTTPNDYSGLVAWYTADPAYCFSDSGGTVPCASGDAVYVWKDRKGTNHLVQATSGNRPIYRDVGGTKYVEFTAASSQYLEKASAILTAAPLTLACWFDLASLGTAHNLVGLYLNTSSASTNQFALRLATSDAMQASTGDGTTSSFAGSSTAACYDIRIGHVRRPRLYRNRNPHRGACVICGQRNVHIHNVYRIGYNRHRTRDVKRSGDVSRGYKNGNGGAIRPACYDYRCGDFRGNCCARIRYRPIRHTLFVCSDTNLPAIRARPDADLSAIRARAVPGETIRRITMPVQPIIVGGTYYWFLNPASINTESDPNVFGAWDLTGATVTVSFLYYGNGPDAPPTATGQHFIATVHAGSNGRANYINAANLFTVAGTWGVSWKVSLAGIVLESEISFFKVKASGAAL